jgi:HEAT repeat protein
MIKLLDDEDKGIRLEAIGVLKELPDPRAVEPLCRLLSDQDDKVRGAAMEVLCCPGFKTYDKPVGPFLERARDRKEDQHTRFQAANMLSSIGGREVVEALTEMLEGNEEFGSSLAAATLIKLEEPGVLAVLHAAAKHKSKHVRDAAGWALAKKGDPGGIPFLKARLDDKDERARRWATERLRAIREKAED